MALEQWCDSSQNLEFPRRDRTAWNELAMSVHWWLLHPQVQRWTMQAEAVLTDLVRKGLLLERQDQGQRSHYRVNQAKLETIGMFLNQDDSFVICVVLTWESQGD